MPQDGTLPLQEQFGRYRIIKQLGQGGMGAVYLAHDPQLDRHVALKVPRLSDNADSKTLERFFREARAAATIVHANICPLYEVGEVDGVPFLTMAYIEGKPLTSLIGSGKLLTPRQVAVLVRKLALAMEEAHLHGVIHRDLKPANVMINKHGEPVIMDFGVAHRARPADARLTQEGSLLGTPAYMAPEQASGNVEAMGPATDIYSLGVILYELLTGQLPFTGEPIAVISKVLFEEPPRPSQMRADVDLSLEAICLKALAKKAEQRFRTMAEFASALQSYLRGQSQKVAPPIEAIATVPPDAPNRGGHAGLFRGNQVVAQGPADRATGTMPEPAPAIQTPVQRRISRWVWLIGGVAAAALLGMVIYVATDYGTARIELSDPAAEVMAARVDDEDSPNWNSALRLHPGLHKLEMKFKDYEPIEKDFAVKRGGDVPVHIELQHKQAATSKALDTPQPIAPADESFLKDKSRKTVLRWKPVPGAASYKVEIEYLAPGEGWKRIPSTAKLLKELSPTEHEFDMFADNPVRWRVWAVDKDGHEGPKSHWWTFRFLTN